MKFSLLGNKNPNWKGNNVSRVGLHRWVERNAGKPKICWDCGVLGLKIYHWANISGEYKRDLADFKRLCPKCHKKFDAHLIAKGEKHGTAKLTKEQVLQIREIYQSGKSSYRKLALQFKVDYTNIRLIVKNLHWRNI